jgi:hypothetical protein
MKAEDVNRNDVMAMNYDHGGEGDTPAFLYLLSASLGLNDPLQPSQGSWGSRFVPMPASYPAGYYSTCGVPQTEVDRWIPDAKNSFMARMKWATHSPLQVNHAPVVVLGKDRSNNVLHRKAVAGRSIELNASKSFDRDGNQLSFRWFHYKEAGSYREQITLNDSSSAVIRFAVPRDIDGDDIHLVLEVRDNGSPSLVAYRRVVITGKD